MTAKPNIQELLQEALATINTALPAETDPEQVSQLLARREWLASELIKRSRQ
jgi:hypothetical protein